jgi:predicted transcriptional regulator
MTIREQVHSPCVADVELVPVVVLDARASLHDAARAVDSAELGAVLVDTRPLVECSERDVVHAMAAGHGGDTPVDSLPLRTPPFVRSTTPLADALQLMWSLARRHVLVVSRDGRPLGYLSATAAFDALRAAPPWLGALKIALHIEEGRR